MNLINHETRDSDYENYLGKRFTFGPAVHVREEEFYLLTDEEGHQIRIKLFNIYILPNKDGHSIDPTRKFAHELCSGESETRGPH